jgi:hypothetical protein
MFKVCPIAVVILPRAIPIVQIFANAATFCPAYTTAMTGTPLIHYP